MDNELPEDGVTLKKIMVTGELKQTKNWLS